MPRRRGVERLERLCLRNVAAHMQGLWAKDYAERCLGEPPFRYLLGPFDHLAGSLVQELLQLLGSGRRLTRPMLHLLLVPHLTELSLRSCASLVSAAIAQMVSVRCKNLSCLDLHGCSRISSPILVDLLEGLPGLTKLDLSGTQCDTRVLSAVGSSCRRLRELAAANCKKLSAASLLYLAYDPFTGSFGCPRLQVLSVEGLKSDTDSCELVGALAFLLLALPGLKSLVHGLACKAVSLIHTQQFDGAPFAPGFPSLVELARDRQSTHVAPEGRRILLPLKCLAEVRELLLPAVSAVCPDLEEVAVLLGDGPGLGDRFRSWKMLTHLTLDCGGNRSLGEVMPELVGLGGQLHSLSLGGFCLEDELSFHALLSCCRSLQKLSASFRPPGSWWDSEEQPAFEALQRASMLRPLEFPHLQAFSLLFDCTFCSPSTPEAEVLKASLVSLLRHSPHLESLTLVCLPFSLDEVFEKALEPPGAALRHLQRLSLSESNVSPRPIRQLLSSDNQLSLIALGGCPGIHLRHHSELVRLARQQELDVSITWD